MLTQESVFTILMLLVQGLHLYALSQSIRINALYHKDLTVRISNIETLLKSQIHQEEQIDYSEDIMNEPEVNEPEVSCRKRRRGSSPI